MILNKKTTTTDKIVQREKDLLLICNCSNAVHQLIFRQHAWTEKELEGYSDELRAEQLDEVYIDIHLAKKPFWQRVKYGLKYIFGAQSRFGAFDEIITYKSKLKDYINSL